MHTLYIVMHILYIAMHRAEWVQPLLDWSAEHLAPGVQVPFQHHLYVDHLGVQVPHHHHLYIYHHQHFHSSAGLEPRLRVGLQPAPLWKPQLWGACCCRVPQERVF